MAKRLTAKKQRRAKTHRPDGGKVYRSFTNFRKGDRVRLQFTPFDDDTLSLHRGVTGIVQDVEIGDSVDVECDTTNEDRRHWSIFDEDLSNGILSRRPRTELR